VFKKKKTLEAKKIDTLIGKETSMTGKLEAKGIIRIDGNYDGEIVTQSDIIVGENAVIKARVKCMNMTLAGRLEGNVNVENKFELRSSGVLLGDVSAAVLAVEEGAFFSGKCSMEIKEKNQAERKAVKVLEKKSLPKGDSSSEANSSSRKASS